MSLDLDTYYQRVSRAIRRGNKYDEDIPGYTEDAVRYLENAYNWRHMRQEPAVAALGIGVQELTFTRLKNLRWLRFVPTTGDFVYLKKIQAEQVTQIGTGRPGAWWLKSHNPRLTSTIAFDGITDIAYNYHSMFYQYSLIDDNLPWLTLSEQVLMAETILKMQPILRDDKLLARWSTIKIDLLPSLIQSEIDAEYDGADNTRVPFTDEVSEEAVGRTTF